MRLNLQPVEIEYTKRFDVVDIQVYVLLNETAHLHLTFYSDSNQVLNRTYQLTPEEYQGWGLDDQYIIDLIVSKYQLSLRSN
jgi:hypothetical protein